MAQSTILVLCCILAATAGVSVPDSESIFTLGVGSCVAPSTSSPAYAAMNAASGHSVSDLGDMDACLREEYQYCVLQTTLESVTLTSGMCVPAGCGPADVSNTTSSIFVGYIISVMPDWAVAALLHLPVQATCGDNSRPWDANAIVTAGVLAVLAAFVLGATVYTATIPSVGGKSSKFDQLLRRVALQYSLPPLFNDDRPRPVLPSSANLGAFDGVRVLSMSLVVLGHGGFIPMFYAGFSNSSDAVAFVASAAGQVIPSAEMAVDSFFCLSGALASYFIVAQLRKQLASRRARGRDSDSAALTAKAPLLSLNGELGDDVSAAAGPSSLRSTAVELVRIAVRIWPAAIIHRYLRIVPSLAVFLGIWTFLAPPLFARGPNATKWSSLVVDPCVDHGWTDLVFLQNFVPAADANSSGICPTHIWYLAPEFQLFATLAVPLSLLYVLKPAAGWIGIAVTTAAGLASCLYVSFQDKAVNLPTTDNLFPLAIGNYGDLFYNKPWTRSPAFVAGLALGLALRAWEDKAAAAAASADLDTGDAEEADRPTKGNWGIIQLVNHIAALVLPSKPVPAAAAEAKLVQLRRVAWLPTVAMALSLALFGFLFYIPTSQFASAYMGTGSPWPDPLIQAYSALSRWLWSVALSVLLYLCATRRGGLLGACLGHRFWRPMARLSYWTYLIHYLVYVIVAFELTAAPVWSGYTLMLWYCGCVVASSLAAAVLHLLVEMPFAALQRTLVPGGGGGAG